MEPIRIFRHGKQTFCEWYFEKGEPHGRILNQGKGVYLENEFLSLTEARRFCQKRLEKDASLILYVMQDDDIIDSVQNDAYQTARAKRIDRLYAIVSFAMLVFVGFVVSMLVMPFETVISHTLFIGGIGLFYLLQFMIAGGWHLESVATSLLLLVLLVVLIPLIY